MLRNEGPAAVRDLCITLGTDMLRFAEPGLNDAEARRRLAAALESGKAAEKFARLIEFQKGDPRVVEDPTRLPQARRKAAVPAPRAGVIQSIETERMGFLSIDIGCGRRKREDTIDFAAGFLVEKTVGDRVEKGEPLAVVCYGDRPAPRPDFEKEVADLFTIGDAPAAAPRLEIERL